MNKQEIISVTEKMRENNRILSSLLNDKIDIRHYQDLVRTEIWNNTKIEIWTSAMNRALCEHQVLVIPDREEPYYIDDSIIMHENNRIEAGNAVIRQKEGVKVLMIRNENVIDETEAPCSCQCKKDSNLSIEGGIWEEMRDRRGGYGRSGMYDENRSMYGVSTCMLFSNVSDLTLTNISICCLEIIQCITARLVK